jgi:hypothetical protein
MTVTAAPDTPLTGIYLYCLARLDCLAAVKELAEDKLCSVDQNYCLAALPNSGVVAVLSEVLLSEFSEANLQDLSWLGERAMRHEAVVARIMDASPVLPVKFGTLYKSQASLKQFMQLHHGAIDQALERLRDKAEWSVKGYLLEEQARKIISAEDPDIQARRDSMSQSPGMRYLQQKQLETKIDTALEAALTRVNHDLHQALALKAEDSTALRLHASSVTGRAERMVFNGGFLLGADTIAAFRAALAEQQEAYQVIGLTLELRGPWPPYNFCPDLSDSKT